jgi:hypothetical protein
MSLPTSKYNTTTRDSKIYRYQTARLGDLKTMREAYLPMENKKTDITKRIEEHNDVTIRHENNKKRGEMKKAACGEAKKYLIYKKNSFGGVFFVFS